MLLQKLIHVSLFALLSQPCCKGIFVRAQQRWGWPGVTVARGGSGHGAIRAVRCPLSPTGPVSWAGLGWGWWPRSPTARPSPGTGCRPGPSWEVSPSIRTGEVQGGPWLSGGQGQGQSLQQTLPGTIPTQPQGWAPRVMPVAAGLPSCSIKCSCNSHLTAVPSPL